MSDINAQQFTTRNSVSLITLSGAHRSGNILDKFIDLLIGNKQVSFNYEFPFRYFRGFRKLNGRDKKDTRVERVIRLSTIFFHLPNLNESSVIFILFSSG